MPHRRLARCAVALGALVLAVPVVPAAAAPPPTYVAPVDAPVVDAFRPPAGPYEPGNRGLEYGTEAGVEVRAAADGVVSFAGVVGGTRHVTILHADGLRTSYSFLARIDVVVGQRLQQRDVVGTTGGRFHLGARAGDSYLDPASLFAAEPPHVHLVPFDEPPGPGPDGERSALRQLIGDVGRLAGEAVDQTVARAGHMADWLRGNGPQLLRTAAHYLERTAPGLAQLRLLQRGIAAWERAGAAARRPCTAADASPPLPPAGRRMAVLVGGLGSSSQDAAIDDVDTEALGYDDPDVVRFSYAGGRTPDPADGLLSVAATAYGAADTLGDLRASARLLADLLEDVADAAPGTPVDLYAHSQGGIVARLALIELERRHGVDWLRRVGLVATLGTPHGGADLATAIHAVGSTQRGSALLDAAAWGLQLELDDDATATAQLAETSDVVAQLASTPIPAGVPAVTIAARGDLVVPVPRTAAAGATHVVVAVDGLNAHDGLPGSPEAARELALALSGHPPGCRAFRDALVDQLVGEGISWMEDTAGSLVWMASMTQGAPVGG